MIAAISATKMDVEGEEEEVSGSEDLEELLPLRDWRGVAAPRVGWCVHVGSGHMLEAAYVPLSLTGHPLPE